MLRQKDEPDSDPDSLYDERLDLRSPCRPENDSSHFSRPSHSDPPVRFAFAQAFGERGADAAHGLELQEGDMISAVRFNASSDMVATGDKGGRIVILKRVYNRTSSGTGSAYCKLGNSCFSQSVSPVTASSGVDINLDPSYTSPTNTSYPRNRSPSQDRSSQFIVENKNSGYGGLYDTELDPDARPLSPPGLPEPPVFQFWTQFQSHEPEFDYLKSMEIEEKINQIRWCRQLNGAQRLIATNDKTIKLWRVFEKDIKQITSLSAVSLGASASSSIRSSARGNATSSASVPISDANRHKWAFLSQRQKNDLSPNSSDVAGLSRDKLNSRSFQKASIKNLVIPRMEVRGTITTATPRRVFSNSHAYHINSISLNSDEETFLSADDLRVNLWNLHASGSGFNILDIKPDNMEDLTEVITSAEFHPRHCHIFMYSNSRGVVKVCDLRQSALCQSWAKEFEESEDHSGRSSFFSEIIASISDIKFSPDGRYVLTRDYMNLRLWDLNMEREPVLVVPVHEQLRSRLSELYANDCIFDKFQCCFSSDGGSLLTGSYRSLFQAYSAYDGMGVAVEASIDFASGLSGRSQIYADGICSSTMSDVAAAELADPTKRITHLDASSTEQLAAVAAGPALYLYYAPT